jgi:hypothetical protein
MSTNYEELLHRSSHGSSEIYVRGCIWASADHSPCRGCTCGTDCTRRARAPVLPWLPRWTSAASAGPRRSAADWGRPPPCRSSHSSSQSPLSQPLSRASVSGTATSAPGSTTPSNPFPPEPPHAHSRAPEPPAPMPSSPFKTQHSLRSLSPQIPNTPTTWNAKSGSFNQDPQKCRSSTRLGRSLKIQFQKVVAGLLPRWSGNGTFGRGSVIRMR